jgi:hypothetical protein
VAHIAVAGHPLGRSGVAELSPWPMGVVSATLKIKPSILFICKVLAIGGGSATSNGKPSIFFDGFWPFEVAKPPPRVKTHILLLLFFLSWGGRGGWFGHHSSSSSSFFQFLINF